LFVDYNEDAEPTHERKPLRRCWGAGSHSADYIVLTPDGDVYVEALSCPPFRSVLCGDGRALPPGLGAALGRPVYIFGENGLLAPESLIDFKAKAEREMKRLRRAHPGRYAHAPPPVQALVELPAGPVVAADAPKWYRNDTNGGRDPLAVHEGARVWVVVSAGSGDQFGQEVPLDVVRSQGVVNGDKGVLNFSNTHSVFIQAFSATDTSGEIDKMKDEWAGLTPRPGSGLPSTAPPVALDAPEDARTLPVERSSAGERHRVWRSVADALSEAAFSDWPLSGPRTAAWYAREIGRTGMGPVSRHHAWRQENNLKNEDGHSVRHEMLSEVLELLGSCDQLDLSNLAGVEALARALQYEEFEVRKKSELRSPYSNAEHFMGRQKRVGGCLICPDLTEWVATKSSKDSAILKEQRKADEERALAKKREK
jgi:hypothetical protein